MPAHGPVCAARTDVEVLAHAEVRPVVEDRELSIVIRDRGVHHEDGSSDGLLEVARLRVEVAAANKHERVALCIHAVSLSRYEARTCE